MQQGGELQQLQGQGAKVAARVSAKHECCNCNAQPRASQALGLARSRGAISDP